MMPESGKPILWEELTWKDVDILTKTMKMAIIPTAACEQHGPHLPLSVDTIDCYEVAKRVSAKTGVPVILLCHMVAPKAMEIFQGRYHLDPRP
jgi:creatinine amidohydrolase/Fe(II)-dependent formamide hydrolase-like protein